MSGVELSARKALIQAQHQSQEYERGHLYSMWSGRLRVYEGPIMKSKFDCKIANFMSDKKRFLCSSEPGVVYNCVVWLKERNDELAIQILMEYEKQAITSLTEKIHNHVAKIKLLKGAKIDEYPDNGQVPLA